MANLIAHQTGNFGTATTWKTGDTTMVKLDGTTESVVPTSAGASSDSSGYTGMGGTVDGLLINLSRRAGTTGTLTVTLRNSTDAVDVFSVTINVADLPAETSAITSPATAGSWHFFDSNSSYVLNASKTYVLRVVSSSATQVYLLGGASNNWNVVLRMASGASAPSTGDRVFIGQEYLSAGSANAITVTMDDNDTDIHGACDVSNGGTLTWSTATNTRLIQAGNMRVWGGATYNHGTSGTPIPAGTTSSLEFSCSSDVQYGFETYWNCTVNIYGFDKTYHVAKLAADASAGATSLTLDTSVGANWKNGDNIVLASTTRTNTETEMKALTADGSGTTLTITAITNAHSGTSPTQGEVVNLTRNIQYKSTGANSTYFLVAVSFAGTFNASWIEFINHGSATTGKRGIQIDNINGTATLTGCVARSCAVASAIGFLTTSASATNITFNKCVAYAVNGTSAAGFLNTATSGTMTFSNCIAAACTSGTSFSDLGCTFTDIMAFGNTGDGFRFSEAGGTIGTISGLTAHSNGAIGVDLLNFFGGTVANSVAWRNSTHGFNWATTTAPVAMSAITLSGCSAFGNGTANIEFAGSAPNDVIIDSFTSNAGVTLTCPTGIRFGNVAAFVPRLSITNSSFGATTAHSTADILVNGGATVLAYIDNTILASTTEVSTQTNLGQFSYIRSAKHDQTASNYKAWFKYGTVERDTSVYRTASPSEKITPNNASSKVTGASKYAAIASGATATISVYINKDAAYNGNQPRLMVRRNESAGITADTALATYSAGTGSWNQISGTTAAVTEDVVLEFYVDCDGTAGFINVDDWAISGGTSVVNDQGGQLYDYRGMAEGWLASGNNIGETKYDFRGLPSGGIFLTASGGASSYYRALLGVGI